MEVWPQLSCRCYRSVAPGACLCCLTVRQTPRSGARVHALPIPPLRLRSLITLPAALRTTPRSASLFADSPCTPAPRTVCPTQHTHKPLPGCLVPGRPTRVRTLFVNTAARGSLGSAHPHALISFSAETPKLGSDTDSPADNRLTISVPTSTSHDHSKSGVYRLLDGPGELPKRGQ